ncbi:hypothetical protein F3Y22_tig00110004pilonHSYRG00003 [Hibiscus syriacus]|uniref:Uncharacterized protein n=1 Tax=Hibiscus syriacus TaxID=106335 RepID=A0A6A3BQI6_HIBSY|nr:hypothetical protein F3Y22_tig00110004pilonHSYRG00003 [Hibiscus syriacus]
MDMEESLMQKMEDFSFTATEIDVIFDREEPEIDGVIEGSHYLIGKLISRRTIDGGALCCTFWAIWVTQKVDEVLDIGDHYFRIKFTTAQIMTTILNRSPWTFKGDLFALAPFVAEKGLEEYDFDSMAIWIRIFNLPLGSMTKTMGLTLGNGIGTTIAVDMRVVGGTMARSFEFEWLLI